MARQTEHRDRTSSTVPPPATRLSAWPGYDSSAAAAPSFIDCAVAGRVENSAGLDNQEAGLPLLLCRPSQPWPQLWPSLTRYG
jgi:hypothetical protein